MLLVQVKEGDESSDQSINEVADSARDMLHELLETLEEAASSSGYVVALVDNLNKAIASVSLHLSTP